VSSREARFDQVSSELRKRSFEWSVNLSTMSLRARRIATVGVLWALLVGAAIVTTVRRGGMKVVVGAEPGSTLAFERQYDIARMFSWIGVVSVVALVAIVITYVVTIRSASRAADEFEYEVVPTDRTGEPDRRRRHLTA
jgi:hypothetical protein